MGGGSLRRAGLVAAVAVTMLSLGWGSGSLLGRDTIAGTPSSGLLPVSGAPVLAPRGPTKVSSTGAPVSRSDVNLALIMLAALGAAAVGRRRPRWTRFAVPDASPSLFRHRYSIALRAPPAPQPLPIG